jgi:SAM-dependent methyltransferase
MAEMMKGYQEDLAYIHDAGFTGFMMQAGPGLLEILRRNRISGGLVVDLGCGSGVWAKELIRAGYDVLGIDMSASMIRLARKRAPGVSFRTASLLQVKLPRCDAVTSIGECVNYRFDRRSGSKALARLFRRVYDALRSGGVFVFDIAEPGQILDGMPRRKYSQGPDWAVLVEIEEDRKRMILTRRIISFRKSGKAYRRSEETHRLRLYKRSDLATELRRVGFKVRILRGYGRFRFPQAHAGFLARKP